LWWTKWRWRRFSPISFPCQSSFPQFLHNDHHLSSGDGTINRLVAAAVPKVPPHELKKNWTVRRCADKSLVLPICSTNKRIFLGWVKEVRTTKLVVFFIKPKTCQRVWWLCFEASCSWTGGMHEAADDTQWKGESGQHLPRRYVPQIWSPHRSRSSSPASDKRYTSCTNWEHRMMWREVALFSRIWNYFLRNWLLFAW
jgi:hypothetical protein